MKRLHTVKVGLLVVIGILCLTATGWASIPEPDVIYYGKATHRGDNERAMEEISLVLNASSRTVASYVPDSIQAYGEQYVLRVPMDVLASIEGQAATFYIGGRLAGTTHIPSRGTVVQKDLDTLTSNDSDGDGMDDTWEMQYFGTLDRDGSGNINGNVDENGNPITDLQEYQSGTDPTAAVWQVGDDDYQETCVFHPLVFEKALVEAALDDWDNRIKLQGGTYAGNFSYTAAWGEDFDLEIVGGYDTGCNAVDAALTELDGNGNGPALTLDTATGQTAGNIRVENLYVTNGSAPEGGGIAIVTDTGGVTLLNNIITGNIATDQGGGISLRIQWAAQTLLIANNTIDGNEGGGMYCNSTDTPPVIMNNIITYNTGGEGIRAEGAPPDSDYNNLFDNDGGSYNDPAFQGDHDISVDPLFVLAVDFNLRPDSPCIDAGENADWLPASDILGNVRITDGDVNNTYRVDMGAFELSGNAPPDPCDPFTDEDCDTVADEADKCAGLDDTVDTNNNELPDCSEDGDSDGMPNWWEATYSEYNGGPGLDPNTDDGGLDLDGDGFSNFQEFLAGTYPNNSDPNVPGAVPPNQAPTVPKPSVPANQSKVTALPLTLIVENASDDDLTPPFYEFVVYAAEDMTSPVATSGDVEEDSSTTSWEVDTDLVENAVYRWRVRAKDDEQDMNTWSAWSNFFTFFVNTANEPPTAPSLNSPQDGKEVKTSLPTLVVDNATDVDQDALTYQFELDKKYTFDSPALEQSGDIDEGGEGITSWTPTSLDENTTYYWRARACDKVEVEKKCSPWMTTANFLVNTVNDQPTIPQISAPPDGALVTVFQPVLEVTNAGDADGDPLTYEFQLFADAAMATGVAAVAGIPEASDGTTAWQVDKLLQNNGTYWWRAQARDDKGRASGWCDLVSFALNTANTAPYGLSVVTPLDGASVQALEPALLINNATDDNMDPITYYFEIDTVSTFDSTALQRSSQLPEGVGGRTLWRPPLPLTDGTEYHWRVIAYDGKSYSAWTTASFTVDMANYAPSDLEIFTPKDGEEVQTLLPSLVIKNAADDNMDPITYYFEIDKVNTYDSTSRQQSPGIPEGIGDVTSWRPSVLTDNTTYFWRVIAYDGASYSDWREGSFFVNLANDPPGPPTIEGPVEGSEVTALSPVLTVHDATDVDMDELTYDYEVYADPYGTHLVRSATGAGTSWPVGANLEDNTFYWWRFRARDDEGATSAWSGLVAFFVNTVNDAPTAPSVNSPQDGWTVETLDPVLQVNNATDVDSDTLTCEFEIDTVRTFNSSFKQTGAVYQTGANTTSWIPLELEDDATYYWRARACDEENCSEWMQTAMCAVNTSNEPPSIPNVSSPPDGSYVATKHPTLEITNATDPDQDLLTYDFELFAANYDDDDDDESMKKRVAHKTGILEGDDGTTSWQVYWLSNKKTYWWRVQARDHKDASSGWSTLSAFTVDRKKDAPTAPSIVSPGDGEEVAILEPTLEINNATDDDGDTLTYLFETDHVNTFDSPARQKSSEIAEGTDGTTSWTPSELDDNTIYYWRARAFDGAVYGDWTTGSFLVNVDNEPPDIPTIQNPDEGCLLTMSSPTLSVYPATDPDQDEITYDYEVYLDANLQDLVTSTENEGTSWKVNVGLEDQVLYYWRARAFDGVDYSDWCPLVSFSLNTGNAQPGAPTHNNPFNGGIVTTLTPTLSVNNAEDPDNPILTYEFELYSDISLTEPVTSALVSQGILITS